MPSNMNKLWAGTRNCQACELRSKCKGPVPGYGNPNAKIMLVGEAPGAKEDESGYPFRENAPAGATLNKLLELADLTRNDVFITNVVKCRPSDTNATPSSKYIKECAPLWLEREIETLDPDIVVAMGSVAVNYFSTLRIDMDSIHGLPLTVHDRDFKVIATYHPAAALHNPAHIVSTAQDFDAVGRMVKGLQVGVEDAYPSPYYEWVDIDDEQYNDLVTELVTAPVVSVDVELLPPYHLHNMYSFQLCIREGESYAFEPTESNLSLLKVICENKRQKKLFHNLIGVDWQTIVERYGIKLVNYDDTMVRAYLLGWYPQSLKALSRRYLGMYMEEYDEIVYPERKKRMIQYYSKLLSHEWPNPEPVEEKKWNKELGQLETKIRKPQNIKRKVMGHLNKRGKDLWKAWHDIKIEDGRGMVEEVLGPVQDVSLKEVAENGREELVLWYCARDADATLRLYNCTEPEIKAKGLEDVLELDLGTIPSAAEMMRNGIKIDPEYFYDLADEWQEGMDEADAKASKEAGMPFLITSPQQTAFVLYDHLGLPVMGRKKSTDAKTLEELGREHPHPVLEAITEYRHLSKLRNTYAIVLPEVADRNNRVHTTLKLTRTATGRLSSAEPVNLMNQPTRGEEGPRVREGFIAENGWTFVGIDLSQIEMRVLAHLSEEPALIRIFNEGLDIHTATAAECLQKALDEITKDERRAAKSINFGLVYGETAKGLARQLGWSIQQAEDYLKLYFARFPYVKRWMQVTKSQALNYGWVFDMIGRRRYIPEVLSPSNYVMEEGFRKAINMPVQASAQIPIKRPMKSLQPKLHRPPYNDTVRQLLQIHDELMYECRKDMWEEWAFVVKEEMENSFDLIVPVVAEAKVGERWGSMKEMAYKNGRWVEKAA